MSRIFKILFFLFLFLTFPVAAQEDFSEIHLPQSRESDTFLNVLENDQPVLTGTINVNNVQDENLYAEIVPYHRLYFGNVSIYEEQTSFSNIKSPTDVGIKIQGGNGLINYSTGIYNIQKSGAWASVNPLHHLPEAGKLDIGTGFYTNRLGIENETEQVNSLNLFTGYKFKRFSTRGEFIRKDYTFYDDEFYDIWKFSNRLKITENLSLKAGYREYEQTNSMVNDYGVEYSLGNIKLELETSLIKYFDNPENDSERFQVKTRYAF